MKDKLERYNEKRNFDKTSEPQGKKVRSGHKHVFVVQHHEARRDHYDLRLEFKGVLVSWAVPKGPSYDTKDKRLAVMVEDHPYDYKDFEGVIPKGEYGGGTVMLWDEGYYECEGDFEEGLHRGSLKFRLFGKRLKGKWALVKYKEDNWLLIKEQDGICVFNDISVLDKSIRTGRTMKEIADGKSVKKVRNSKKDFIVESVQISNPEKAIFMKPKVTKYELAVYYQKVAERMLPYLNGRLLSTVRLPNGAGGEKFFAKHNFFEAEGVVRFDIPNDKGNKEDYYHIENASGLISEVQMNSYEFHIWGSKIDNIEKPDMLVFDFDPDEGVSLKKIRDGVRDLKSILDELNLKSFLKTSGGKGYHVVVPTDKFANWEAAGNFARDVAKLMESKWPDKYSANMRKDKRKNKIFIDWVRNTRGATSVAPYSIRLKDKCRVSMPIRWSELDKVGPFDVTISEAIKRLKRKDPWEGFFERPC